VHLLVALVPAKRPDAAFTNAGMNSSKNVFLGLEKRDYSRATASQKCVRAGGKHNDLEQTSASLIAITTFFEMLGNFSFGDYFKKDAIAPTRGSNHFAGCVSGLIRRSSMSRSLKAETVLSSTRCRSVTTCGSGKACRRIAFMSSATKDNFWQMGDTGPCGPCSEIHYDMAWPPATRGIQIARLAAIADGMSNSGIWCSCSSTAMIGEN